MVKTEVIFENKELSLSGDLVDDKLKLKHRIAARIVKESDN